METMNIALPDSMKHFVQEQVTEGGYSSASEYVRDANHTNTVENFFSIFKRGVIGTYHHWSQAHIHRYLVEFDFRYSTKDVSDAERTTELLRGIVGKRLTYRRTTPLFA